MSQVHRITMLLTPQEFADEPLRRDLVDASRKMVANYTDKPLRVRFNRNHAETIPELADYVMVEVTERA